ncbi:nucleoside triphosphate pyrophosphohydrolase [Solibacillus cecembensis]|uniref:nucleoside triphosphate pyrophosphohydrolase n=1 Tax=Solibacillus cecembensis TaxID=459347 RepID=UPI003D03387D
MAVYHKLVRDLIPQVIEADGKICVTKVLDPSEHLGQIKTKMQEEALEFQEANSPTDAVEELADILELVHAALHVYGVSYEQLEQVRIQKKEKRGGFSEGIYLIEVEDD